MTGPELSDILTALGYTATGWADAISTLADARLSRRTVQQWCASPGAIPAPAAALARIMSRIPYAELRDG